MGSSPLHKFTDRAGPGHYLVICMLPLARWKLIKREDFRKGNTREMEFFGRPNRSDVHLSKEEEVKIEEETRDYFDGIAPKRHTKPQRSEYSSSDVDALSSKSDGANHPIPELMEFQRLEGSTDQKLIYNGSQVVEEFVETAYYKDLNCIDKQHHQTGTGFIKMENSSDKSFSLTPDASAGRHTSCKGNPATNDWIPSAAADMVGLTSDKPNRSEN